MAIAFRAASTVAIGTTALSIGMPTGTVQNDFMVMVISCHDTTLTPTMPSGWAVIDGPVTLYSTNGACIVATKRAGGSEAGPYAVSGLEDSCCGYIMSFSGCRLGPDDAIDTYAFRANAAGASGTAGIGTSEANEMIISTACVMDNLALSAWTATSPATLTERADGRTTNGSDTGVGGATAIKTTAGATGATAYTIASPTFENIGGVIALVPLINTPLTVASSSHAHTADNTSITNQNSTLAVANCAHAHTADNIGPLVENKTLAVANCSHATTSSTPTPVHNIVAIALTYFYTWILTNPVIGGVPGPKLCVSHDVVEVSSYVTGATSVAFNIEERGTIGSAGTNILAADQTATVTGASSTSPSNANLAKDSYLWLDISAVTDTPGTLEVTLKTTITYNLQMNNCAHVVSSTVVPLTQAHTLIVDSAEHAVTCDNISAPTEHKTLAMADCTHAVASSVPTLTQDVVSVYGDIPGFWAWIIDTPVVGGIPGPKLCQRVKVKYLQSYTTAADYVDFNIEERDTIGSTGTDILSSDQRALTTGALDSLFSNDGLPKDSYLWLDISAVSGTPECLMVTLIYEKAAMQSIDNCTHAVTSDNIDLVEHKTLEVADCAHAVTSSGISLGGGVTTLGVTTPGFYCWVMDNIVVGGFPGPKMPSDLGVSEVSSYIVGGTSVTFNIESRTAIGTPGTDILVVDQVSDTTGESAKGTDIAVGTLIAGRYLWVDIEGISGSPTAMMITLAHTHLASGVNSCSHGVTSDNIDLVYTTHTTLTVSNCTHAVTSSEPALTKKLSASTTMDLTVTPVALVVANCSHAVTTSAITFTVGATRVYLPSSGTPTIWPNPGWGGWDEAVDADQIVAVLEKGTTARTEKTMTVQNYSTTTSLNRQYVLGDVKGLTAHDFTTSEAFTLVVQCEESDLLANATLMIEMNVWDITGTVNYGTPYTGVVNTNEFALLTPTSRYCTKNFTADVSMAGGSILTIEFGASCALTEGSEFTVGMYFGDAPADPLSLNNNDTGADYPYVDFPFFLNYYSTPLTVASCSHAVTSDAVTLGNIGLTVANCTHAVTSTSINLADVLTTLTPANCTHAVSSSVINFPAPPGRRLYVKVKGHWIKIAPEGG